MSEQDKCRKCGNPFKEDGKFLDSARQRKNTPFCSSCYGHCLDSEIADHVCMIDRWFEEQRKNRKENT